MIPSAVFVPGVAIQSPTFYSPAKFSEIWEHAKDIFSCFVVLKKAYDLVLREKLCEVLREYGADGCLLLVIKLLYIKLLYVCLCLES